MAGGEADKSSQANLAPVPFPAAERAMTGPGPVPVPPSRLAIVPAPTETRLVAPSVIKDDPSIDFVSKASVVEIDGRTLVLLPSSSTSMWSGKDDDGAVVAMAAVELNDNGCENADAES